MSRHKRHKYKRFNSLYGYWIAVCGRATYDKMQERNWNNVTCKTCLRMKP